MNPREKIQNKKSSKKSNKKKDSEREVKNENLNKTDEQSEMMNEEILRSARKIMRELNEKEDQYECIDCKLRFANQNILKDHVCNNQEDEEKEVRKLPE